MLAETPTTHSQPSQASIRPEEHPAPLRPRHLPHVPAGVALDVAGGDVQDEVTCWDRAAGRIWSQVPGVPAPVQRNSPPNASRQNSARANVPAVGGLMIVVGLPFW